MTQKKFAPRPDRITVGNHVFRVEWLDDGDFSTATGRDDSDGVTFPARCLIIVKLYGPDVPESHYQEVLVHEITHAIWGSAKITHAIDDIAKTEDVEENIVLLQAPGLLSVIKTNPLLLKYLASTR